MKLGAYLGNVTYFQELLQTPCPLVQRPVNHIFVIVTLDILVQDIFKTKLKAFLVQIHYFKSNFVLNRSNVP